MAADVESDEPRRWWVYVLRSLRARRTYVGISTDVVRRLRQHNGALPGGAKSTRAHRPWGIGCVYGPFDDRGDASRCEAAVKRRRGEARLEADYEQAPPEQWRWSDESED